MPIPRSFLSPATAIRSAPSLVLSLLTAASTVAPAHAGPLDPPAGPVSSTYKTLDQVRPGTPITTLPVSITQPGVYYLTGHLSTTAAGVAIAVSSPNVTIDLGGFTLAGPGTEGTSRGIQSGGENTCVINGTVKGFRIGVEITARNCQVRHVVAQGCGWGIYAGGRVSDCVASENTKAGFYSYATLYFIPGFGGFTATGSTIIERCVATANGETGFSLTAGSLLTDSVASLNRRVGIGANGACRIERCSVTGTVSDAGAGFVGVGIALVPGCSVSDCQVAENAGGGIQLADNCVVSGANVNNNNGFGIGGPYDGVGGVLTASNCDIRDCTVSVHPGSTTGYGIAVNDNSAVVDCTIRACYEAGIYVRNNCRVTGNHASGNGHTGGAFNFSCQIVTFGNRNHFEDNTCTSGPNNGIMILGQRNVIIRNVAGGNITNFLVSGNIYGPIIDRTTSSTGITTSDPSANISY